MTNQIPLDSLVPSKIYLQIDNEFEGLEGVTWCVDKIDDTDIEYVIADESVPVKKSDIHNRLEKRRKGLARINEALADLYDALCTADQHDAELAALMKAYNEWLD